MFVTVMSFPILVVNSLLLAAQTLRRDQDSFGPDQEICCWMWISTSARLLRLVSLLSTRPSWTNGELAERMDVTERTGQRDIAKLLAAASALAHRDPTRRVGRRAVKGTFTAPSAAKVPSQPIRALAAARRPARAETGRPLVKFGWGCGPAGKVEGLG
jgi:hypothetical protein